MSKFIEVQPTIENHWRAVILFGRNVASYKFALGHSLLELAAAGKEVVTLEELAIPFSAHICQHLKHADKQGTSKSSRFLEECRRFNAGEIGKEQLIDTTEKRGFDNVIDAFHVVHSSEIDKRFFTDERKGAEKGIRLTEELFKLAETYQIQNLPTEIEARWRLVETAWELGLPASLLSVEYDVNDQLLVINDRELRRKAITGCRDALNGYQKGKCFYCFSEISINPDCSDLADVDHFFPNVLKTQQLGVNIDGVWNLVLACKDCNRGERGKFAQLPEIRFLERLHRRNEFFIASHHPLRETLINQTGKMEPQRISYLQNLYKSAKELLIVNWCPKFEYEPAF